MNWLNAFAGTDIGKLLLGAAIAIFGIVVSQVMSVWKDGYVDKRKRERSARFLALRLVLIFDDFASTCYNAALNNIPEISPSDPNKFRFRTDTPNLKLPEDADWELLDPKLTDDALWLENKLKNVHSAHSSLDISPPDYDDLFEHRAEDYSKLGLTTLELIERLCRRYKIKPPERPEYYKPKDGFERQLEQTSAFFDVKAESQRLMWEQYEEDRKKREEAKRAKAALERQALADVLQPKPVETKDPGGEAGV